MDRLKIPTSLALLGLSFTGCGKGDEDTIVGTWELTMAGGQKFPVMEPYYEQTVTVRADMQIGDDLTGLLGYHYEYSSGVGDESETFSLVVDDSDAPTYVIEVMDVELVLSCQLSGTSLDCTDLLDMDKYTFKKR